MLYVAPIDLKALCQRLWNWRYEHRTFPGLIWQRRTIGGNYLVFSNGIINCNGSASSLGEGRQRLRQYARHLHNLGIPVKLKEVKILTVSTSHTFSSGLDLQWLAQDRAVVYEPELFPALNFKVDGVNFYCFHTGKVVITGIKCSDQLDDVVYPTVVELELYTRKKQWAEPYASIMEQSKVYQSIHYLEVVRDATPAVRKTILQIKPATFVLQRNSPEAN